VKIVIEAAAVEAEDKAAAAAAAAAAGVIAAAAAAATEARVREETREAAVVQMRAEMTLMREENVRLRQRAAVVGNGGAGGTPVLRLRLAGLIQRR